MKNSMKKNSCIKISAVSDTGKIRSKNEDNCLLDDRGIRFAEKCCDVFELDNRTRRILAVCDGMGGEAYGDLASRIAVASFSEFIPNIREASADKLHNIINLCASEINNRICDMAEEMHAGKSGSTLAMVCIDGENVRAFNIGDSRIYFYKDGKLSQITEDQTVAMRKLKAGIYTPEEAKNSRDAHGLTSYLGSDMRRIGLKALAYPEFNASGGKILICSDGLTDMCSDELIAEILGRDPENTAGVLVQNALNNGGEDNITCIVINFK